MDFNVLSASLWHDKVLDFNVLSPHHDDQTHSYLDFNVISLHHHDQTHLYLDFNVLSPYHDDQTHSFLNFNVLSPHHDVQTHSYVNTDFKIVLVCKTIPKTHLHIPFKHEHEEENPTISPKDYTS